MNPAKKHHGATDVKPFAARTRAQTKENAGTAPAPQFTPATASPVFSQRLHNAHSALASVHAASVDRLRASRRAQAEYPAVAGFRGEVFQNLLACDRTRGAMKWLDSIDRASVRTLALQFIRSDRGMRR